jgi:hypothetical protein
MWPGTSEAQAVVMENLDLTQRVNDRRAEREADAQEHRLTKPDDRPAQGEPRLRYVRHHRTITAPRHSLA